MPVEFTDTTSRTRYVRVIASPFVTVDSILSFADKLRAAEIPLRTRIDCGYASDTRHLTSLSARVSEDFDNCTDTDTDNDTAKGSE